MAMDKHNGHVERGHGHTGCRMRGSGRSPRRHDGRSDRRAGQPVVCGVHGDADPSGRQTPNLISGHGRRISPAGATLEVAARKIAEIARLAVEAA